MEMNRSIQEREVMRKKQEIKRHQEKLRQLEASLVCSEERGTESRGPECPLPSVHQNQTSDQSTVLSSVQQLRIPSGRQENTMEGIVRGHYTPPERTR